MSPLKELKHRQRQLKYAIDVREDKLKENMQYIHNHAGTLALSGLSYLLFPALRNKSKEGTTTIKDYFTTFSGTGRLFNDLMPLIIGAASPLLIKSLSKKIRSVFKKT